MVASETSGPIKRVGRYAVFQQIAAGGMATVHLARLSGPAGFSRVVAVKALHPHLIRDPEFKHMLIDEARLAARIRHPNVVPTLDVVASDTELFLVMEYVQGESLSALRKAARRKEGSLPPDVCAAIMAGVLHGLHAAHEAENEKGEPLHIVHRDVSPQNILVGIDGVARVLDFGVAKAMQSRHDTRPGQVKGKSSYMAPEQIRGEPLTQRVDIFAAAVVFWELLTARRLFGGATEEERVYKVLHTDVPLPSVFCSGLPSAVDDVVMKGLRADPTERYASAREMAEAIESTMTLASQRVIGDWVMRVSSDSLKIRTEALRQVEITKITSLPPAPDTESAQPVVVQADEESLPSGGLSDYTMGASSPWETPWWRDRRALLALGAVAILAVVGFAVAGLTTTSRAKLVPLAAAAAESAAHAAPLELPSVRPPPSFDRAPADPSALAAPPHDDAPRSSDHKPAAASKPATPARPASKSGGPAGARAFRPTEL
jgi:serine/threonine-protein kinase